MENQQSIYNKVMDYPWDNLNFVQEYLAQTFYYVNRSEKLLCLAMARLEDEKLFRRFKEHLNEENAHDRLALNDLKKFGSTIENHPELTSTRAFYQMQYYQIEHNNPLVLMGYIHFLEDLVAVIGPKVHKKIEESLGFSSVFLKLHYEEDEEHVKEAQAMIESLPIELKKKIHQNHHDSQILFINLLDEIKEKVCNQNITVAA